MFDTIAWLIPVPSHWLCVVLDDGSEVPYDSIRGTGTPFLLSRMYYLPRADRWKYGPSGCTYAHREDVTFHVLLDPHAPQRNPTVSRVPWGGTLRIECSIYRNLLARSASDPHSPTAITEIVRDIEQTIGVDLGWPYLTNVTRLDVTTDAHVPTHLAIARAPLNMGARSIGVEYKRSGNIVYAWGESGGWKTYRFQLYDNHARKGSSFPYGQTRMEARLNRPFILKYCSEPDFLHDYLDPRRYVTAAPPPCGEIPDRAPDDIVMRDRMGRAMTGRTVFDLARDWFTALERWLRTAPARNETTDVEALHNLLADYNQMGIKNSPGLAMARWYMDQGRSQANLVRMGFSRSQIKRARMLSPTSRPSFIQSLCDACLDVVKAI